MMDIAYANISNVKIHSDDVAIHSANKEYHVERIQKEFKLLLPNELRLRMKKVFFMQPKVELLGNLGDKNGFYADEYRTATTKMHLLLVAGSKWAHSLA